MIELSKMPPSLNCMFYTDWKTKSRHKSKAYRAWIKLANSEMQAQPRKQYRGVVKLNIKIGKGQSNADCPLKTQLPR